MERFTRLLHLEHFAPTTLTNTYTKQTSTSHHCNIKHSGIETSCQSHHSSPIHSTRPRPISTNISASLTNSTTAVLRLTTTATTTASKQLAYPGTDITVCYYNVSHTKFGPSCYAIN